MLCELRTTESNWSHVGATPRDTLCAGFFSGSNRAPQQGHHFCCGSHLQAVLPDADHSPAACAERPIRPPVPSPVVLDFQSPKFGSRYGNLEVFRAAMPEAAIRKNRDLELRKCEIRPSGDWPMSTPPANLKSGKDLHKGPLGGAISPASNSRHERRSLGSGHHVRHIKRGHYQRNRVLDCRSFQPPGHGRAGG